MMLTPTEVRSLEPQSSYTNIRLAATYIIK
jgi:hypothetical protein